VTRVYFFLRSARGNPTGSFKRDLPREACCSTRRDACRFRYRREDEESRSRPRDRRVLARVLAILGDSLAADTQSRVGRPVRSSEIVKSDIHCSAVTFKARHCGRYLNNNSQLRFAHLRVRKYPFPFWPVQMNSSAND